MVGFLEWFKYDKELAVKFQQEAKKRGLICWIYPPTVPEYAWQVYFEGTGDAAKIDHIGMVILASLGLHKHVVPNIDNEEYHFEGPYENFPYPGGKCQSMHGGVDCAGNRCDELTPYEVRVRWHGDHKECYDKDDEFFKWVPRCPKHLIEWVEDSDGPFTGADGRIEVRLVEGENLLTGFGNNVEFQALPSEPGGM